jgi:DNA polymerase-4
VRFETRGSGPGPARTFASDTNDITSANPVDSLDWPDYVAALAHIASAQAVDDVAQR